MKTFIVLLLIIFIVGFTSSFVVSILDKQTYTTALRKVRCENAGGLYYPGNIFAADNCVFPPTNP